MNELFTFLYSPFFKSFTQRACQKHYSPEQARLKTHGNYFFLTSWIKKKKKSQENSKGKGLRHDKEQQGN